MYTESGRKKESALMYVMFRRSVEARKAEKKKEGAHMPADPVSLAETFLFQLSANQHLPPATRSRCIPQPAVLCLFQLLF